MINFEQQVDIAFKIINQVAASKKTINDAIALAREGKIKEANDKVKQARNELGEAQRFHGDLVQKEAAGEKFNVTLLLMHAEDQMMTTENLIMIATEMIHMYEKINVLQAKIK